jgi:hypothetical protein
MSDFLPAKYILVDFLRSRLVDPRARAEASDTDTFTATAGQTDFVLTPTSGKVSCVTGVTVNSASKVKWQEYWVDFRNQTVKFFTGLTIGDSVDITYKYGTTNWIHWDKPRLEIGALSFPRINILTIGGNGTRLGNYQAPVASDVRFQIDIWTKMDQVFTISSRSYEGEELSEYIASKIIESFETYESDLFPALYDYSNPQVPRDIPYDETYQCYHKVVEVSMSSLALNRI